MIGPAVKRLHMHIRSCATREALEKVVSEFGLKISNQPGAYLRLYNGRGSSAQINSRQAERLVHRHEKVTGAQYAFAISQRLIESLAQSDADILDAVVLIDIQVAIAFETKIERSVACKELQHVIEEANAGGHVIFALTIDI